MLKEIGYGPWKRKTWVSGRARGKYCIALKKRQPGFCYPQQNQLAPLKHLDLVRLSGTFSSYRNVGNSLNMSFSKNDVFTGLAEVGMALANKHRLQIVSLFSHGPKTVEQLVEAIDQSKATTSAHLKTLRTAGLVNPRREGKYVWNSLSDRAVEDLRLSVRTLGERLLPGLESKIRD